MSGRECYHCKQWIGDRQAHDCWTTTEAALTQDLTEDLRDAWERVRETALALGDQRIYASHKSIMFSRKSCYFFVRPKRNFLELCVFLGREVKAPQVRRVDRASKSKVVHTIRITHRDEVEAPVTDWLREAYAFSDAEPPKAASRSKAKPRRRAIGPAAVGRVGLDSSICERELTLRIVLEQPPKGVKFGLQKGRGSAYAAIQKQLSEGNDLSFEFSVLVKAAGKADVPALAGPFVQGPAGQRFVYIDIGTYAGQADSCWSRRLKIPLTGITADKIAAAKILEARVPGTGRDGGPSCATVKPFDGWKVKSR